MNSQNTITKDFPNNPHLYDEYNSLTNDKYIYKPYWKFIETLTILGKFNCTALHQIPRYNTLEDAINNQKILGTIVFVENNLFILIGIWELIF